MLTTLSCSGMRESSSDTSSVQLPSSFEFQVKCNAIVEAPKKLAGSTIEYDFNGGKRSFGETFFEAATGVAKPGPCKARIDHKGRFIDECKSDSHESSLMARFEVNQMIETSEGKAEPLYELSFVEWSMWNAQSKVLFVKQSVKCTAERNG